MFSQLKSSLLGEIYFSDSVRDKAIKRIYATDASEYQELPIAVVVPKNTVDIIRVIDFASKHKLSLIPRAAGTSLAGQVVGNGIIVDISVHFNRILAHNREEKWVKVQPGVIRDDLNVFLKPHGLMFGPETSTANRAMIGGMIGNNSCGLHSIIWGTTRDHLLEVKAILSDGSEVVFKDLTSDEYSEKLTLSTLEGDIYRQIDQLIHNQANQKAIDAGFPKKVIKRRNTGYALDFLLEMVRNPGVSTFNLAALIAGSEGTLCFITEAKLRLIELPPLHVGMVAIHTNTLKEALEANLVALDCHCAASELVDDFILEFTKTNTEQSKNRFFIEGEPKAILMVEFFADSESALLFTCENLIKALQAKNLGYAFPILLGDDAKKAWEVRKGGLGLLRNLPGDAKPVNLIEDCAVDPKDLPAYIAGVEEILKKNDVKYSMYAHAGAGELHVEPILNLKTELGLKQFRSILYETVLLVKSFGGSLSGEHGDGRLRGEFIPLLMGEKVYNLFKEIKFFFDPKGVFNKGKITDTPPMDKFLRYSLEKPAPLPPTIYDFSKQGGYLRLAEKCSGSGDCRKTEVTGGTMCPSFMATRNERDTTRARANILRQYLTNEATLQVSDQEVKEILDLCLSCKACKSECPSSVDMAKMKGEFTQSYYDKHGIPFRARLVGDFPKLMKVASFMPRVYNLFVETPFLRKKVNQLVGFHADRTMPKLAQQTLFQWYKRDFTQNLTSKKVYVFCDEFTNYTDAEIGKKMVILIQKLGYTVEIVENSISGRTYLSKGLIREAQKIAVKNINTFAQIINENAPLIGIEPSAILTFRDEYLDLVPPELSESAQELARNCFLFEEWFCREMDMKNISKEVFSKQKQVIRLHGHCHQKSLGSLTPTKKALSFPENYSVYLINSGCCGMAGSFGYEKEHYDISMNIGELSLFPSVRKTDETELIVASGTSCRHQIKDGTNRESKHPIEVLFDALNNS